MDNKVLYHTLVENKDGIQGTTRVLAGGSLSIPVSNPVHNTPGSNPEQLIGMALATCLNATIEAEEKRRGLKHQSEVRVGVDLKFDDPGFQFILDAQVKISEVSLATAQEILAKAEQRCPVAKLLTGSSNVTVRLVDSFEETNNQ